MTGERVLEVYLKFEREEPTAIGLLSPICRVVSGMFNDVVSFVLSRWLAVAYLRLFRTAVLFWFVMERLSQTPFHASSWRVSRVTRYFVNLA
jgi:hypothetical protein